MVFFSVFISLFLSLSIYLSCFFVVAFRLLMLLYVQIPGRRDVETKSNRASRQSPDGGHDQRSSLSADSFRRHPSGRSRIDTATSAVLRFWPTKTNVITTN